MLKKMHRLSSCLWLLEGLNSVASSLMDSYEKMLFAEWPHLLYCVLRAARHFKVRFVTIITYKRGLKLAEDQITKRNLTRSTPSAVYHRLICLKSHKTTTAKALYKSFLLNTTISKPAALQRDSL